MRPEIKRFLRIERGCTTYGGLSIIQLGNFILLALALFIAGCTPAGPRALLNGKKYLDRGDYAGAVAQLKTATALLATNAKAWNYYGVALQRAGQPDDAAEAYQARAGVGSRPDEAHYNLGSLWLEQNKPDAREDGVHRLHVAADQRAGGLAQARRRAVEARRNRARRKKVSARCSR